MQESTPTNFEQQMKMKNWLTLFWRLEKVKVTTNTYIELSST